MYNFDGAGIPEIREIATNGGSSLSLALSSSLTKLTISVDTLGCGEFGHMMRRLTSAQELCIRASTEHRGFNSKLRPDEGPLDWKMPSVSHLRLEWEYHDYHIGRAVEDIDLLLKRGLFPDLEILQFEILAVDGLNIRKDSAPVEIDLFGQLLYKSGSEHGFRFPNLTTFEFHTDCRVIDPPGDTFFPIHEFHVLRHLTLKGIPIVMFPSDDGKAGDYYTSHRPPTTLQSITLEGCDGVTSQAVVLFLEALRRGLEYISVVGCKNIDEAELGASLGGTKLFYYPG